MSPSGTVLRPGPKVRPAAAPSSRRHRPARPPALGHRPLPIPGAVGRRLRLLRLVLVLLLVAVAARLFDLQVLRSSTYQRLAAAELSVTVADPGLRGALYDRNGAVLAISVPTKTVVADDFQVHHPVEEAAVLAPLLHLPAATLATELHQPSGYVTLATQVPASVGAKLAADGLPGITLLDSSERVDPDGGLAAPVLGQVHASGAGASGLEYEYNQLLAGHPGTQTLLETPAGVDIPSGAALTKSAGRNGTSLELTLDEPLQYVAEQALAKEIVASQAKSGEVVVMDTRTGDILAMANLVAGNNGLGPVPGISGSVSEAPENLAVTQAYEPGSVFKLVPFSAALQNGLISPSTTFTVPDQIQLDGSTFHDAEAHPTEQLSATEILAQSSNIGTSEVATLVGEQRLLAQVRDLGFGTVTGLHFPGETPGILVGAAQWEPTNDVSFPIGQVDAVSALQVLDAYNAVANGGVLVQPRLVRATIAPDGTVHPLARLPARRVFSPSVDAELISMFGAVVTGGTGTAAAIPGYTVIGKTGTSQIPAPGQDAYIPGAYMATFVGAAPAPDPVLSAIVVLDRPTPIYGGSVSAPVFAQVMGYALHRYGIPTSPSAPTQVSNTPPSAASQAQDVT